MKRMINRFAYTTNQNRHKDSTKTDHQKKGRVIRSLRWLSLAFLLAGCGPSAVKDVASVTPVPVVHTGAVNPNTGDLVAKTNNGMNTITTATTTTNTKNGHAFDRTSFGTRVPVLCYHHILTAVEKNSDPRWRNNDMVMTVDQFASEMKYLHDHEYHVITLLQLESFIKGEKTAPYHSVVLTFDDGYESNYRYALPILKQYGYHATIFAIVGGITNAPQPWTASKLLHFSWPEIKDNTNVFDVESHTFAMHYAIKGKAALVVKPTSQVYDDLAKARKLLNADFFAYPYGTPSTYNAQTIELLKQAGYQLAVTTTKGYATKGSSLFEVPRFLIVPGMTQQNFQAIVSGMYQAPKPKPSFPSFSLAHLVKIKSMTQ